MSEVKQDRRQVSLSDDGRTALLEALRGKFPRYPLAVYPDRWQEVTRVDRRTVDKMLTPGQRVRQASIGSIFKDLGAQFDEDVHLAFYFAEPSPTDGAGTQDPEAPETVATQESMREPQPFQPQEPSASNGAGTHKPAGASNRLAGFGPALVVTLLFGSFLLVHHIFFHHDAAQTVSSQSPAASTVADADADADQGVPATGGMVLYDQFKADQALMPDRWIVNGPAAVAAMKNYESPPFAVVTPKVTVDPQNGLGISGIQGNGQQGGVQSVRSFVPPFTVTALCNATAIHGDALRLGVSGDNGRKGVSLGFGYVDSGDANDNSGGFICTAPDGTSKPWQQVGAPLSPLPPATDIWYVLTIVVDASGKATAAVSSGGFPIGKATTDVGHGPFYVVMSQEDGSNDSPGPNQAYCGTIQVISEAAE